MSTMPHLFGPEGMAALSHTLQQRPLLAFDFDGTLSPIVARPEDARLSQAVAARLKALGAQLPLAIVSGRSVADLRARLGFEPQFLVGNHGAENAHASPGADRAHGAPELDGLRRHLGEHAAALHAADITLEDKGASLALHYRLSRTREAAVALLEELLSPPDPAWHIFGGKMVINVAPADAPDKAQAVLALVQRSGAPCALYAGDDVNDEPVFDAAPPHWLTVRVGRDHPGSRARFALEGPGEVALLLDRMLLLLASQRGHAA